MSKNILLATNKIKTIKSYLINPKYKESKLYVLTDEIKIHEKFSLYNSKFIKILFKDFAISYKTINKKESKTLILISKILRGKSSFIPNYLSNIDLHIEGKGISRKVRTFHLYRENIERIIKNQNIKEIIIDLESTTDFEKKIIKFISKNNGIKIKYIAKYRNHKFFFNRIIKKIRLFISKNIYFLLFLYRAFLLNIDNYKFLKYLKNHNRNIVITSHNNFRNHVKNRICISKKFIQENQYPLLILGINLKNVIKEYKKENITAFNLGSILNIHEIINVIKRWSLYKKDLNFKSSNYQKGISFDHLILNLLENDIQMFISYEILKRIYLWRASIKFNNLSKIVALRLFLNFNSFLGNILYEESLKNSHTIYFRNDSGWKWGYESKDMHNKFYHAQFVTGADIKKWYEKRVNKKCKVIISGSEISNIKITSKSKKLNKILFISTGLEKGTYSLEEFYKTINQLAMIAKRHRQIDILYRPHPAEKLETIKKILNSKLIKSSNFLLSDGNESLDLQIMDSDLIISRNSSAILNALSIRKPVILVSLDQDNYIYKILSKVSLTIRRIEKLDSLILFLLKPKNYQEWSKDIIQNQNKYLKTQLSKRYKDPLEFISKKIIYLYKLQFKN